MNSKPGSATYLLWASEQVTYFLYQFIIFKKIYSSGLLLLLLLFSL